MASTTTARVTAVSEQPKKRVRPNPARRKASKAKTETTQAQPAAPGGQQITTPSPQVTVRPTESHTRSPSKSTQQASKKQAVAKTKTAVVLPKPTSVPRTGSHTRARQQPGKNDNFKEGATLSLAQPAMVTGGLVGCAAGAAVLLGAGIWKTFAGTDSAILTARSAKLCLDNLIEEIITSLQAGTYNAPEALDMLRRTTLTYASAIPGGAPMVERTFREIDLVRQLRGRDVDRVLEEAYAEVARAGSRGASAEELQTIVFTQLMRLSEFATDATQDLLARNPSLKSYSDGAVRALRRPPSKVPTVKLNLAIQHKPTARA